MSVKRAMMFANPDKGTDQHRSFRAIQHWRGFPGKSGLEGAPVLDISHLAFLSK
jgi:hypothetical protein